MQEGEGDYSSVTILVFGLLVLQFILGFGKKWRRGTSLSAIDTGIQAAWAWVAHWHKRLKTKKNKVPHCQTKCIQHRAPS